MTVNRPNAVQKARANGYELGSLMSQWSAVLTGNGKSGGTWMALHSNMGLGLGTMPIVPDESVTIGGVHDEPSRVTVLCPECGEYVIVKDVHAFLQQFCTELTSLHAET